MLASLKIPSFCLKPRTIYPTQSIDGSKDNMGTVPVPSSILLCLICIIFVCYAHLNIFTWNLRDINVYYYLLLSSFQGLQMGIFGFWTERDWSQKSCYGNSTKEKPLFSFKFRCWARKLGAPHIFSDPEGLDIATPLVFPLTLHNLG